MSAFSRKRDEDLDGLYDDFEEGFEDIPELDPENEPFMPLRKGRKKGSSDAREKDRKRKKDKKRRRERKEKYESGWDD